jgi:hypothetical protein
MPKEDVIGKNFLKADVKKHWYKKATARVAAVIFFC